jgi:hypothetical protein
LSSSPVGLIVKAHKVRSIRAGFQRGDEWLFLRDTQRIEARGRGEGDVGTTFRPTKIMQRVSETVSADEGLTGNAIRTAIGGRTEYVSLALELLVSEGYIEVRKDGQAHLHYSIRPYREDCEPATVSTVSLPFPNHGPDTVSHRVPLPVGEGPGTGNGSGGDETANRFPSAPPHRPAVRKDAELKRRLLEIDTLPEAEQQPAYEKLEAEFGAP